MKDAGWHLALSVFDVYDGNESSLFGECTEKGPNTLEKKM